ncbi:unnamed protein product [Adineta steineri]|nr:unnamed protein product [Adineta steineri]
MEYKKLFIDNKEQGDIELDAYDASPEYKSESENKNNIKQSTRPQRRSKIVFCFSIIAVVLILITIISISIWAIFIKKNETPINTTAAAIDASSTGTIIRTTSTNSHTIKKNVSKFNKWKQNAIIVAGGNGEGQKLSQLDHPSGIFIDKKKNIFIAERWNDRIVEWKYNAKEGQIIAGENGEGDRIDQLDGPTDLILDHQNHSIIIADFKNSRVIRWWNQNQQILIQNITCYGLAMDKHGFLYVSDWNKNEVRRWKMGEYNEGTVVAGGNGQGDQLNQLHNPAFIFVDEDQSVYVSDQENNRVMKWIKDAKEGRIVAGGNGRGRNLNQLSEPTGVIVDHSGQIYVADWRNHRVMRWCEGKDEGEIVVGGNGGGAQSNQVFGPNGLSFDDEGNLYVADSINDRIAKFEIIL